MLGCSIIESGVGGGDGMVSLRSEWCLSGVGWLYGELSERERTQLSQK